MILIWPDQGDGDKVYVELAPNYNAFDVINKLMDHLNLIQLANSNHKRLF